MEHSTGRLFGREAEMAELARLAATAERGSGQTAFIVGEAGMGKTAVLRLVARTAESKQRRTGSGRLCS
ncbi:ATP-binding protein [Streptomyces sioyaensis]|uniref:ATP-binding protein n=1 Tax=Streptomyces sioyaensis TaxID=67364 RepID=UPI003716D395